MKISKKTKTSKTKKIIGIIALVIIVLSLSVYFLYSVYRGKQEISNFSSVYKIFNKEAARYELTVIDSNLSDNSDTKNLNNAISQIQTATNDSARLALGRQALTYSDQWENDFDSTNNVTMAGNVNKLLLFLNTDAAAIRDSQTRNKALEVVSLFQQEIDTINLYDSTVMDKHNLTKQLLTNLIDNGGNIETGLIMSGQSIPQLQTDNNNLNTIFNNWENIQQKREAAFAQFQGITGSN